MSCWLYAVGVNVKYLIDEGRSASISDLKSVQLDSLDRIDDVDMIIVCGEEIEEEMEAVYNRIKCKTNAQIRPFEWLLGRSNHFPLIIDPLVQFAYYLRRRGGDFYFIA